MTRNLVDDWRNCYKWLSMQISAAAVLICEFLEKVPDFMPQVAIYAPPAWVKWVFLIVMLARLKKQNKRHVRPDQN